MKKYSYSIYKAIILIGIMLGVVPSTVKGVAIFAFSSQENFALSTVQPNNRNLVEFHGASSYKIVQQTLTSLLPPEVDIDALDFINKDTIVFSLREDAFLPGPGQIADEDLLLYNGSVISLLFDGSANGLPAETDIDAIDVITLSPLTCSFSLRESANLPGVGQVSRNDAIRFQGGIFTGKDFNGITAGIPAETNLDGFSRPDTLGYIFSCDAACSLGGTNYDDADLVRYTIAGGTFSSFFNAAANGIPAEVNLQDAEANAVAIPVELSQFYSN